MRTVYQQDHGLAAYRWVVFSGTGFRLAQPSDMPDGIVASISDKDRFNLETVGEVKLDGLELTPGQGYGVGTDGVVDPDATSYIAKATARTILLLNPGTIAVGGGGGSTVTSISVADITDMTTFGRNWVTSTDGKTAKPLINLAKFNASISGSSEATIAATLTADRTYTLPDISGTFAMLQKEQTFTARQWFTGAPYPAAGIPTNSAVIGGGNLGFTGYIECFNGARFTPTGGGGTNYHLLSHVIHYPNAELPNGNAMSLGSMIGWVVEDPATHDTYLASHIGYDKDHTWRILTESATIPNQPYIDRSIYMDPWANRVGQFHKDYVRLERYTVVKSTAAMATPAANETVVGNSAISQYGHWYIGRLADLGDTTSIIGRRDQSLDDGGAALTQDSGGGVVVGSRAQVSTSGTKMQSSWGSIQIKQDTDLEGVSLFYCGNYIRDTRPAADYMSYRGGQLWVPKEIRVAEDGDNTYQGDDLADNSIRLVSGRGFFANRVQVHNGGVGGGYTTQMSQSLISMADEESNNVISIYPLDDGGPDICVIENQHQGFVITSPIPPVTGADNEVRIGGGQIIGGAGGGSFTAQPLVLNNVLVMDNSTYYGSSFHAIHTGPGTVMQMSGGDVNFYALGSATAGAAQTPTFTARVGSSYTTIYGSAPSTPGAGEVRIGGGTVFANGSIKDPYTIISGAQFNRYDANSLAGIDINFSGYNGGFTQFRNLNIYDGKGNLITIFDGSSRSTIFRGTAPTTAQAGEVRVGNGEVWGANTNGTGDSLLVRTRGFGYGPNSYYGPQVGNTQRVALGFDPSTIAGGDFSGVNVAVLRSTGIIVPNSGNTDWRTSILLSGGGTSGSPALEILDSAPVGAIGQVAIGAGQVVATNSGSFVNVRTYGSANPYIVFDDGTGAGYIEALTGHIIITPRSTKWTVIAGSSPSAAGTNEVKVGGGIVDVNSYLRVAGTQVVTARKTGWTAATGTATRTTFATGFVTTAQLAERVKALIDDLISHGLIGT